MADFKALFERAHAAGHAAATAMTPRPMIVGSPSTPFGSDVDLTKPHELVADGVCGFAWIKFKGNTPWARWCKAHGHSGPAYPTGHQIWVKDYNQSMQRKEAYARAFAAVLQAEGIKAYAQSRMD